MAARPVPREIKSDPGANSRVAAMRRFNRFYTRQIGVLQEGYSGGPFSLAEARVLYEIIQRKKTTASDVARELGLDAGYLSRILRAFETKGYIQRESSDRDGRQSFLTMTRRGITAFEPIEQHTENEVRAMLSALPLRDQDRLIDAMQTIESVFSPEEASATPYILRPLQPGDIGWVVARHGVLYGREFGWDHTIEALTAEIAAAFVRNYDPKRECCWIAERDDENVGCVFIVKEDEETARLRLLLVDPSARGLGIGKRLVEECIRFSRQAGYKRITLWTHRVLTAARKIYIGAGFMLTREWTHDDFGKTLVAETWDLDL
ncbi:MAG: bifunctional helix-turn-helix transcriptional regulator/GNAT family N-acetyltransferase [Xanthobacteraceae bacterium]